MRRISVLSLLGLVLAALFLTAPAPRPLGVKGLASPASAATSVPADEPCDSEDDDCDDPDNDAGKDKDADSGDDDSGDDDSGDDDSGDDDSGDDDSGDEGDEDCDDENSVLGAVVCALTNR